MPKIVNKKVRAKKITNRTINRVVIGKDMFDIFKKRKKKKS
jgi:hypothetical protein